MEKTEVSGGFGTDCIAHSWRVRGCFRNGTVYSYQFSRSRVIWRVVVTTKQYIHEPYHEAVGKSYEVR